MTAKHTPGPWRIDGGRCGPRSDHLMIVHGGQDTFSPIVAEALSDSGRLPRDANARLIAAAPELLDACETALAALEDEFQGTSDNLDVRNKLREVIAKAKGE